MSTQGQLLPFVVAIAIKEYDPPRRLWHIPTVGPGICPGCSSRCDGEYISAAGKDWHPECFRCSLCRQTMPVSSFTTREDLILHTKCYMECFNERCSKCTEICDPRDSITPSKMPLMRKMW